LNLFLDFPSETVCRIFGFSPETIGPCHIQIDVTRLGRLPEGCITGHHTDEDPAGLCSEIMVRRKNGQARTEFYGLSERHAFEDAFLPGLGGDGKKEGSLGMRGGHDHRPVPELRPDDPCHSNGKSWDVNMYNVTIHDSKRPFSWIMGLIFFNGWRTAHGK